CHRWWCVLVAGSGGFRWVSGTSSNCGCCSLQRRFWWCLVVLFAEGCWFLAAPAEV
ncbi:hypothetical protein A2U01_0062895, partial [Trifolium medium]|nr:hypothetical protein [Trifolium medium]